MDAEQKLISVVMPAYNSEKYLHEAIESILNQTYRNFELLIFDDGSTDATKKIIQSFTDSRIIPIFSEINVGVSRGRNTLIEQARGEYIALMDADDIAHQDRLKCQLKFLELNNLDLCGSRHINLNQETGITKKSNEQLTEIDIKFLLSIYCPICNSTIFGRSEVFKKLKYKTNVVCSEDYYFLVDCAISKYKIEILDQHLLTYRQYTAQSSSKFLQKFKDEVVKVQRYYLDGLHISNTYYPRPERLSARINTFSKLIYLLRKEFGNPSFKTLLEIYSRFQIKQNGVVKLINKLERLIVAVWLFRKVN
jgi:glycosyltransferase involved in cell wall biosynthesis